MKTNSGARSEARSSIAAYFAYEPNRVLWCLLVLLSLLGRFADVGASLWLDEAWVANSVLAPTLRDTLYFERWAQSSPFLFLVLSRSVSQLVGYSEPALRIVPLAGGLLSLAVFIALLRRWFSPLIAFAGVAVFASNYWLVKYPLQVKQYGTDVLTACVLMLLLDRVVRRDAAADSVRLAILASLSTFMAFASVFWFPACVLAVMLPARIPSATSSTMPRKLRYKRGAMLALILSLSFATNYFAFVRPNLTNSQFRDFGANFIDFRHLAATSLGLARTFGILLVPTEALPARIIALAMLAIISLGAILVVRDVLTGNRRAIAIVLAAIAPFFTAVAVSSARLYPMLNYPRLVIWAVPGCVVLLCYAVQSFAGRLGPHSKERPSRILRFAFPAGCLLVVALSHAVILFLPRASEQNRTAIQFIKQSAGSADVVFVHGGMYEQYRYYSHLLSWKPDHVYIGNTTWPCCALRIYERSTNPYVTDLLEDVNRAAFLAKGHTLWLLLPAAAQGHWSSTMAPKLKRIPEALTPIGCRQNVNRSFDQTLVLAFSCP